MASSRVFLLLCCERPIDGRCEIEWVSEEEIRVQIAVYLYSWAPLEFRAFGGVVVAHVSQVQRETDWVFGCDLVVE